MKPDSPQSVLMPLGLIVPGVAIGAAGIYVGDTDDAPGAALIGIVLMLCAVTLGASSDKSRPLFISSQLFDALDALLPIGAIDWASLEHGVAA